MMNELILKDSDVFVNPTFPDVQTYTKRITVKAIVERDDDMYGFVTNPQHECVLLAGGGADSDNLELEIKRECLEELGCEVTVLEKICTAQEYRNRNAIEYETFCFLVRVLTEVNQDKRTKEEMENDLRPVWLTKDQTTKILESQVQKVKVGEVEFYNTSFNIIRDQFFWQQYLQKYPPDCNHVYVKVPTSN